MGGEDWAMWIDALKAELILLAPTVAILILDPH
jgi:trans-2-enoyl-CoA reductase